jgi:hypothetical protein
MEIEIEEPEKNKKSTSFVLVSEINHFNEDE